VIAFDFDGVVVDSRNANVHFYNHLMERVGRHPVEPREADYIHMHPAQESLRFLLRDDVKRMEAALAHLAEVDFNRFSPYLRLEPGLRELLRMLRPARYTALATNRTVSTPHVLAYLELSDEFDLVATAGDVTRAKPHPEMMELILQSFGVGAGEVLYVGDSPVDEEFAAASGVWFAAFKKPELKAHLYVEDFQQLIDRFAESAGADAVPGGNPM
jgi:HAD superfamily hydrolase (TIGR01509 family)